MKNKIIIKILKINIIIFIMMQSILPIKVMALEQNYEKKISTQNTIFDSNITYSWEFLTEGLLKDSGLLTPSNADEYESLPLIVWLHGSSGATQDRGQSIKNEGLPRILLDNKSGLENFSAYIWCPQNFNKQHAGMWYSVDRKIDELVKEYNVDADNVIITGNSLGGNGAIAWARKTPDYFSKAVIFSAEEILSKLIPIPTIWYVGSSEPAIYRQAATKYDALDAKKDVCWVGSGHTATGVAYKKDDGDFVGIANNNRSDLVEWMFEGYEPKLKMSLDNTSLTLPSQQIKQLNVISGDKLESQNITWTSSDKTVAEVDANGLITALKEGQTTIMAQIGTVELTCQVTVSGKLGDVDKDGTITSFDAYKVLKASVDSLIGAEIEEQIILTSDVNKNQKIESEDAYEILKYSVGLINKFH